MAKKGGLKYVIRKRGMGDVLWTEPVIRTLAGQYRKLVVYTKFPELFARYPYLNVEFRSSLSLLEKALIWLDKLSGLRRLAIHLDNSYEQHPKMHLLHAYQREAGLPETREYPRLYGWQKLETGRKAGSGPYVVLHLESFANQNYRNVYGIDWPVIVKFLNQLNYNVVQIGKSINPIEGADWHPTENLDSLIGLIAHASFFIGIDSGPSHIAASVGKPSLIFFGSVNPNYRHFPEQFKGYFLQQYCEFAGCYHTVTGNRGATCRLVGDQGIPKCSLHSNPYLLEQIQKLIGAYVDPPKNN